MPFVSLLLPVLALIGLGLVAAVAFRLGRAAASPQQETELDEPARRARRAQRAFVDALAHDLRTPLSAILGYHELLGDGMYGRLDPKSLEPLRRIGVSAHQIEQIVAGLTEFVRPYRTPPDLARREVEPLPLLREAAARAAELARERGSTLELRLPGSIGPLRTDPERLMALLDLVLAAAVRGSPRARLVAEAGPADGGDLVLHVHGTGISDHTFVPQSLDDFALESDEPERHGSLRLAIVGRLARQLGGGLELLPVRDGRRTLRVRVPPLAEAGPPTASAAD